MDPVRINIVFDAQGRPQLQRAAADLTQISTQLRALSSSTSTAGRAFRLMENDLNRFSYMLHRTSTQGIGSFNSAFERTYGLFSQMTRVSFYAAIGQLTALGFSLKKLGSEFFSINEQFAGLEITLQSMFGSLSAAKKVREEIARITISSPLALKDLADATRAAAAMPALGPQFSGQIRSNTLSNPEGFLHKYVGLLEKMTTFRPDKATSDAVFALREAITGELRSLVRRFEFSPALLVQASGKPLDYLKQRPEAMLDAMQKAFGKLISDKATFDISRQPSRLWGNILEQAVQIPLLRIGRAGENDQGEGGLYRRILEVGSTLLNRFGEFAGGNGAIGPQALKIGQSLTKVFDMFLTKFDRVLERGLSFVGAGRTDVPGAGKIERVYYSFQRLIEYLAAKTPAAIAELKDFATDVLPLFTFFFSMLKRIGSFIRTAFDFGPTFGLAGLIALKSLPGLVSNVMGSVRDTFVETMQTIRASVLGIGVTSPALMRAMAGSDATSGGRGFRLGGGAGTYQSLVGNNPFLYNRETLSSSGFVYGPNGRLYHASDKTDATGYFGQTYSARAGTMASSAHLPSSLMQPQGQRFEEVLARNGMAFNNRTNQIVWAPGSGRPSGQAVGAFNTAGMFRMDNSGLPNGVTEVSPNRFRGPNGRFVSSDWVLSNMQMPQMTSRQAYSQVREGMLAQGSGRIASTLAGGTAGLMTGLGFGLSSTSAAAGAVGAGTAALVSTISPILIAVAGTAVLGYLYDKISSYAEAKRSAATEARLDSEGIGKFGRSELRNRLEADVTFGRNSSALFSEIQSNATLAAYREAASSIAYSKTAVTVPGLITQPNKNETRLEAQIRKSGEYASSLNTFSVSTDTKKFDMAGLIEFRTRIIEDLTQLAESDAKGDYSAKTLKSLRQKLTNGMIEPFVVGSKEALLDAQIVLRRAEADTRVKMDAFIARSKSILKDSKGRGVLDYGQPFNESDLAQMDYFQSKLRPLTSEGGFVSVAPQYDRVREGVKAFDVSPDLRQIIEGSESALSSFEDAFDPFRKTAQIFTREKARMASLTTLGKDVENMLLPQIPLALSAAKDATQQQADSIDRLLNSYKEIFGKVGADEFGKIQVRVPVTTKDEKTGVESTELVLFEEYALAIKDKLQREIGPETVDSLRAQVANARYKIPASLAESLGLQIPNMLEGVMGASRSLTDATIEQITGTMGLLEELIASAIPEIDRLDLGVRMDDIAATFRDIPGMETAISPIEKSTIDVRRMSSMLSGIQKLNDLFSTTSGLAGMSSVNFDEARNGLKTGVTKFTSKLKDTADALVKAANEMEFGRFSDSFNALVNGDVRGGALGKKQVNEAASFAQRSLGVSLGSTNFTTVRPNEERLYGAKPFAREQGRLEFINGLAESVGDQIRGINTQLLSDSDVTGSLRSRKASLEGTLRGFEELTEKLGQDITSGRSSEKTDALNNALETIKSMTDPALGYKLSRRGSLSPQTQWQSGRFGQADNRSALLESQFNSFNGSSGNNLTLQDDFKKALTIDTRGFSAVTGEVQRLIAFQKQYIANSEKLAEMAADPTNTEQQVRQLQTLSESWAKLADEAERTRESIVGNGGVLSSFGEGFAGVVSQWNASAANWTNIGAQMAETLSSQLSNSLVDIMISAQDAGEAIRQLGFNIAETAARMVMNKTIETLLGAAFSGLGGMFGGAASTPGGFSGSSEMGQMFKAGRASGGIIPGPSSDQDNTLAYVASGEYIIPSKVVRKFGVDHFESYRQGKMPSYANGGMVSNLPVNSPSLPRSMTASGSSMSVNVPVSVTINGGGGSDEANTTDSEERSRMLAQSLQRAVKQQLLLEQRQGGALHGMRNNRRNV